MIFLTVFLFLFAAILGLTIAIPVFKKTSPNRGAVAAHGLVAAVAVILLVVYTVGSPHPLLWTSIAIFVVAALGGATLAYRDIQLKKPGPAALVAIHAIAAVVGLGLVLFAVFG